MNWLDSSHQIVGTLVVATWIIGFGLPILRGKLKDLSWLTVSVLGIFVAVMAVDLFFMNQEMSGTQKIWSRGWVGPRDQNGAITIGILEDALGLSAAIGAALLGLILSSNRGLLRRETSPENVHSGVLMSVAGVSVAWLSLTPWLSILGLALVTLGGFVMLSAKRDPEQMAQFARSRSWGFVFSFLGAAVLAGGRPAILLDHSSSLAATGLPPVYDCGGGALLLLGLYIYLQPFPFLAWVSKPAKVSTAASAHLAQLLPAFASLGLVIRLEPLLRPSGVFTTFGWISLVSAGLAAFCGLLQTDWKTTLPLWISAALSLVFSELCFFGAPVAFAILLGVVLSGAALSFLACAQEKGVPAKQRPWLKLLVFSAIAPGIGFVGFVSSGGMVRAMFQAVQDPVRATFFVLVQVAGNLLLWKCGFSILGRKPESPKKSSEVAGPRESTIPLISAGILTVLSLGLFWSGTFTGSIVPHDPDRVFPSWLGVVFSALGVSGGTEWADDSVTGLAEGLFAATLLLPGLLSIGLFGRGQDVLNQSFRKSSGFREFVTSGFAMDRVGGGLVSVMSYIAGFLDRQITTNILVTRIPRYFNRMMTVVSNIIDAADRKAHESEAAIFRQWVEVPAKVLQLIQNGDVQWYLFFAIGSVVAILIHFMRA